MRWKSHSKILFLIVGVILSLICSELILRLYETQRIFYKLPANSYRILVLGESVTDIPGVDMWPEYLERRLNSLNTSYSFRIFNEAKPGASTPEILSKLDGLISKYKPHLVIAMMGANDKLVNFIYNESKDRYEEIRILSLFKSAFSNIMRQKRILTLEYNKSQELVYEGDIQRLNSDIKDAKISYHLALEHYQNPNAYLGLGNIYLSLGDIDTSRPYFEKSYELEKTADTYYYLGHFIKETGNYNQAIKMYNAALSLDESMYPALIDLWELTEAINVSNQYVEKYKTRGFQFLPYELRADITRYHYRLLNSKLKEAGVKFMVVQYPTEDIHILRTFLDDDPDVIFVSNEENFETALSNHNYYEIFKDRIGVKRPILFRGEWGHTTPYGSQLIAEQVAEAVQRELR